MSLLSRYLKTGTAPTVKSLPQLVGCSGVDPSVRVGPDVVEELVDVRVQLRIGVRLEADVGRIVPVVLVHVVPGGREDRQEGDDAQPGDETLSHRREDERLGPDLGRRRSAAVSTSRPTNATAMPGEQDARELHSHLEAPDEDVAAAGHDVVERTERRAAERHQEGDDPDRHQRTAGDAGAPAPEAHDDADADEDRDDGEPSVVVELAVDQPGQHLSRAVAVLECRALEHLVACGPVRLVEHRAR